MIDFRPLGVPTLIVLPVLVLAVVLGIWQVQRFASKEALNDVLNARMGDPAVSLEKAFALGPEEAEWRVVRLEGELLHAQEAYLFALGPGGQPGRHVITPLRTDGEGIVLIDRGFIPEALFKQITGAEVPVSQAVAIEGILRFGQPPGLFTPAPDLANRLWFSRDVAAIAAELGVELGLELGAPMLVEADGSPNEGGWPLGGQTIVTFPNNHLQYAIIWFGLALALLAVYLIYHRQNGRLDFK